jgi:hypothetical protein
VTAANLLKSGEVVMPAQFALIAPAKLLHVAPLSVEKYMLP